jgi:uncharacterized protein (TIGR02246 family)
MSTREIHALAQQFANAFTSRDIKAAIDMLADDVEIFDHVPYRFDNRQVFGDYMMRAAEGLASINFGFHQPSCRVFNDNAGIVNTYDMLSLVTKDGKAQTIHGRTTLVFVKQAGQWKIVSAHFSPLPHPA